MKKLFISSFLIPVFLTLFISIFIVPILYSQNYNLIYNDDVIIAKTISTYIWPTPNYYNITSYFGYRVSPTNGASSYHGGIDIGASQGAKIISIADGIIKYVGWYGANGYTVMISHVNGVVSTYGHVSEKFIVSVGDKVKQGDTIAYVGPKYTSGPGNNPYKDASGKTTNGATTGPHLHLAISINNKKVNPLDYLER